MPYVISSSEARPEASIELAPEFLRESPSDRIGIEPAVAGRIEARSPKRGLVMGIPNTQASVVFEELTVARAVFRITPTGGGWMRSFPVRP